MCLHICIYIYMCIYIYIHTCVYLCVYIHTCSVYMSTGKLQTWSTADRGKALLPLCGKLLERPAAKGAFFQ